MNCVRCGHYQLPRAISTFVSDLFSGFRLLNLRNDSLRRRFDAIMYDVQKIEEIMYDIEVRKLAPAEVVARADDRHAAAMAAAALNESGVEFGANASSVPATTTGSAVSSRKQIEPNPPRSASSLPTSAGALSS